MLFIDYLVVPRRNIDSALEGASWMMRTGPEEEHRHVKASIILMYVRIGGPQF